MERVFSMEEVNASRHKGYSVYGIKKGYCDLQNCCEHCNKKVRFWCKVISIIEEHQSKIIKKICSKIKV